MSRYLRLITGAGLRESRRLIVAGVVVASLAFAGFALATTLAGTSVTLGAAGPTPLTVTANWGDTITFVNGDTVAHSLTSARPELSASGIAPGATYTTVLTARTRTYRYSDFKSDNTQTTGNV